MGWISPLARDVAPGPVVANLVVAGSPAGRWSRLCCMRGVDGPAEWAVDRLVLEGSSPRDAAAPLSEHDGSGQGAHGHGFWSDQTLSDVRRSR